MKIKQLFAVTPLLVFLLVACRSTKKITTAIEKKDTSVVVVIPPKPMEHIATPIDSVDIRKVIYDKVYSNKIDYEWFSAKIKVDYDDNSGENNDATAYIHLKKDSLIWISLTGTLGIEGFRVLVTKDSIFVMNKLKKQIQKRAIAYLQDVTQLPFDFATLQDFILGNPVFFSNNITSYRQSDATIQAMSVGSIFKHFITIDTATNQIMHSKLDDVDPQKNRTCDITFFNYEKNSGKMFATDRDITVTEKSKLDIHLRFKQYNFNEPQSFPFNIPKSYKAK